MQVWILRIRFLSVGSASAEILTLTLASHSLAKALSNDLYEAVYLFNIQL